MSEHAARRMWQLYEPLHALTYFAPGALRAAEPLGPGFWSRYVAQRAAPLGPAPSAVVTAAFGGFAPDRIADALEAVTATPTEALTVRLRGIDAAFGDLAERTDLPDDAAMAEAADLAWTAARACEDAGRVLGAANRALPRPGAPHLALWQAATTLREHRGDGHLAALAVHGVSPAESHVLKVLAGEAGERDLRLGRRVPDEVWEAARARLADVDAPALHAAVEDATDRAAAGPWEALGPEATDRLATLLAPVTEACWSVVPPVNPIGLPR
ncbi:SCO6745 family protein [Actinomycetospora atypica]|uniref:SalK n=1 Tax=Actinomycetospora atypica TaxID=1290095 RepID=A0ABV9YMI8_9PSEU